MTTLTAAAVALVLALALVLACAPPARALSTEPEKPQTASLSLGVEVATGNYGTGVQISSVYVPLIATWSPSERTDVGIEIPFVYQSNSTVTTELYQHASLSEVAATVAAKGGPGGGSRASSGQSGVAGLGDVIVRLGVVAVTESERLPQLHPSLMIKCPSASASEGLGTGEFDVGVGLETSKWLGDWYLVAEGAFTYQGKADGFGLQNYFSYTTGAGYQVTDSLRPMLLVKGASAPSTFSGDLLEARARGLWSLSATTSLDVYLSRGLADASPDFGGGVSVLYSF